MDVCWMSSLCFSRFPLSPVLHNGKLPCRGSSTDSLAFWFLIGFMGWKLQQQAMYPLRHGCPHSFLPGPQAAAPSVAPFRQLTVTQTPPFPGHIPVNIPVLNLPQIKLIWACHWFPAGILHDTQIKSKFLNMQRAPSKKNPIKMDFLSLLKLMECCNKDPWMCCHLCKLN